jgi:hypothetical protein
MMANKKTVKRRRFKKQTAIPFARRDFPKEMIRRLEQITAISGRTRGQVFEDFVFLTEATLKALPEQIKAVGATGSFTEDTPETAELFARVRSHYSGDWLDEERTHRIWQHFGEAFALLLEATAPGLWGEPNSLDIAGPLSGPDILGYLYQTWVNAGAVNPAEVYTPWPVARLLAEMTVGLTGEQMVYERLKQALCHPDNILGGAVLLAGLALPEDEPEAMRDYFINRVVPACAGFFEPVTCHDPAIGSSILNLAAASLMPAWMVKMGLIVFSGQDISRVAVALSRSSAMLYGLNSYAPQLEAAAVEAMQAYQQRSQHQATTAETPSPGDLIRQVYRNGPAKTPGNTDHSFEQIFRTVAEGSAVT